MSVRADNRSAKATSTGGGEPLSLIAAKAAPSVGHQWRTSNGIPATSRGPVFGASSDAGG